MKGVYVLKGEVNEGICFYTKEQHYPSALKNGTSIKLGP